MFYVVYCPAADLYVNDEGGLGSYEGAAQFSSDADAACCCLEEGLKVIGPCIEGERV
jgi:hypothetical protein